MRRSTLVRACLLALMLAGCASHPAARPPGYPVGIDLLPVAGSGVSGRIELTAAPGGIHLRGVIRGLAAGSLHGLHIHQDGDCTAVNDGSAGGHFNPRGGDHGDPAGLTHHAGDLANQAADGRGEIHLDMSVAGLTMDSGLNDDVLGHALVLQSGSDDYTTQPDGGGGAAIACGVIMKTP